MSHKSNDLLFEELTEWLQEHERTAGDIMTGEDGISYVMVDGEDGYEKRYLPNNLQQLI